jgi:hypothetical protein
LTTAIGQPLRFARSSVLQEGEGMTLQAIKEAIAELPNTEKTSLVSWLNAQDADAWNRQIEADFPEGAAGMALLEQWDSEIAEGESISPDEFLRQRRTLTHS